MGNSQIREGILALVLAWTCFAVACGSSNPDGKYQDSDGSVTLELKDGKASMNVGPVHIDGTYEVDGDKLNIQPVEGDTSQTITFGINGDGSPAPPPGGQMPTLQKAK